MGFLQRHEWVPGVLLVVAIALAVLLSGRVVGEDYSLEAQQRAAVARDLTAGGGPESADQSRGNQGLVGSLLLAPLPTVLMTLLALLPLVSVTPALGRVLAAAGSALLALYMERLWRRHGVSAPVRYGGMACLMLLPPVVMSVQYGQTAMVFVALVVCGFGALVEWLREPRVRELAISAVLLGLACVTRYQGVFFVLAGLGLVACSALARRQGRSYLEGTAITLLVPGAYALGLWVAGNWLILGDPVFFVRAVTGPMGLGVMDLGSVLGAGCPWLLLGLSGLVVFSAPLASSVLGAQPVLWRQVAAGGATAAVALASLSFQIPMELHGAPEDIRHTVRFLEAAYPNGTFVVSGYSGYTFVSAAGLDPEHRWVHMMHLRRAALEKVLRDYRGRDVFVLVDAEGAGAMGLGWRGPERRVPEQFMFRQRIGSWILFEVLQAG